MSASPKAAFTQKQESGNAHNVAFILRTKNHQKTKIRRSISLTLPGLIKKNRQPLRAQSPRIRRATATKVAWTA